MRLKNGDTASNNINTNNNTNTSDNSNNNSNNYYNNSNDSNDNCNSNCEYPSIRLVEVAETLFQPDISAISEPSICSTTNIPAEFSTIDESGAYSEGHVEVLSEDTLEDEIGEFYETDMEGVPLSFEVPDFGLIELQPVESDELTEDESTFNYDYTLPSLHEYLSANNLSESNNVTFPTGSVLDILVFTFPDAVLIPGKLLPFTLKPEFAKEVLEMMKICSYPLVGLITTFSFYVHECGTIGEIKSYAELSDGSLNLLVLGKQRFRLADQSNPFYRLKLKSVVVLAVGERLSFTRSSHAHVSCSGNAWPCWLRWLDETVLCKRLADLASQSSMLKQIDFPEEPAAFSLWFASNLPISNRVLADILETDFTAYRLLKEINLLSSPTNFHCKGCFSYIGNQKDMFSISTEGPIQAFLNPFGYVFEVLSLRRINNLSYGETSAENSWFPRYSWTVAICSICYRHIGWKFGACESDLHPSRFWGVAKSSIVMASTDFISEGSNETSN